MAGGKATAPAQSQAAARPLSPRQRKYAKLSAGPLQHVRLLCVTESLRLLEWRASLFILDAAVGPSLQQRLERPGLSLIESGGIHQRSEAESIHGVERNAGGNENRDDGGGGRDRRPV